MARRRRIARDVRAAAGEAVARHVLELPEIARAARVGLYAALDDEVPTQALFEALAPLGCQRLLPRSRGSELVFVALLAWDELAPGPFGVPEPPPSREPVELRAGDVVLVPGVAFDRAGNRLGRGGGHYDRTFAVGGPRLVGVCFELQLVARVPHDSRDRPMDAIVTEQGLMLPARET